MRRILTVCFIVLGTAALAAAQNPYGGYGGWGGNVGPYGGGYGGYAGQRGPVSPYSNLMTFGVNPATSYYNFVRPNTRGGAASLGMPVGMGNMQAQMSMFPALQSFNEDDLQTQRPIGKRDEEGNIRVQMPPTGHPTAFNNTLGFYSPMMGGAGAMGNRGPQMPARRGR